MERPHMCNRTKIYTNTKRTKLSTSRVRSSSHRCRIYHRFWANDLTHLQYTIQTKLADINWIADSIRWPPQWWTKSLISFSYFLFVIFQQHMIPYNSSKTGWLKYQISGYHQPRKYPFSLKLWTRRSNIYKHSKMF